MMAVAVGLCAAAATGAGCRSRDAARSVAAGENGAAAPAPALFERGAERAAVPAATVGAPLPALDAPRIEVSLEQLTLTLRDGSGRFERRFPVAAGRRRPDGRSITPTGEFRTGPDPADTWWYIPRRTHGHPFVRVNAPAADGGAGKYPYGLHGPQGQRFTTGLYTDGCIRLPAPAIAALFDFLRRHPGTPVRIE
jgi:hypothetical protein